MANWSARMVFVPPDSCHCSLRRSLQMSTNSRSRPEQTSQPSNDSIRMLQAVRKDKEHVLRFSATTDRTCRGDVPFLDKLRSYERSGPPQRLCRATRGSDYVREGCLPFRTSRSLVLDRSRRPRPFSIRCSEAPTSQIYVLLREQGSCFDAIASNAKPTRWPFSFRRRSQATRSSSTPPSVHSWVRQLYLPPTGGRSLTTWRTGHWGFSCSLPGACRKDLPTPFRSDELIPCTCTQQGITLYNGE